MRRERLFAILNGQELLKLMFGDDSGDTSGQSPERNRSGKPQEVPTSTMFGKFKQV